MTPTKTKAVVPHSAALEQFEDALEAIPWAADAADPQEALLQMIEAMWSVDPTDEHASEKVLGGSNTTSLADLAGDVILITSVVKRASDYQKGAAYLQLTAVNTSSFDGEEVLISTGARKVISKVAWHHAHGKIPFKATVFEGTATQSGNTFYDLLPVE